MVVQESTAVTEQSSCFLILAPLRQQKAQLGPTEKSTAGWLVSESRVTFSCPCAANQNWCVWVLGMRVQPGTEALMEFAFRNPYLGFGATIKLEELFYFPVATWSVLIYSFLQLNCSVPLLNKHSSLKGSPTFTKQKTAQRTLNILKIGPLNKINTLGTSASVNVEIPPMFYSV